MGAELKRTGQDELAPSVGPAPPWRRTRGESGAEAIAPSNGRRPLAAGAPGHGRSGRPAGRRSMAMNVAAAGAISANTSVLPSDRLMAHALRTAHGRRR